MKTALIIPAYKPGEELLTLVEQFRGDASFQPVVVNDGSGDEYEHIFSALPDFVLLLRHSENRGKGAALKTAMSYILRDLPDCALAVTADADGQHRHDDILRVRDAALEHPGSLVLGRRRFEGDVPLRSRFGNAVTRQVFAIASGKKVYDTQTGLRAFDRAAMYRFVRLSGERYEYEINMLLSAAEADMEFVELPIETIYINDNASSHFNIFRDSLKIYMCILKFCLSSMLAWVIDYIVALILRSLTGSLDAGVSTTLSLVGARMVSAPVNFMINRHMVFKGNETLGRSVLKYAALALGILVVSITLTDLLTVLLKWPLAIAKPLVDGMLYVVNFIVQGKFVYRGKEARDT